MLDYQSHRIVEAIEKQTAAIQAIRTLIVRIVIWSALGALLVRCASN
jgi:hypothetical protein